MSSPKTLTTPPNAPPVFASTPAEAQRIYRAIFPGKAPSLVVERFIEASDRLNGSAPPDDVADYYRAIERVNDLEALEVAARIRGRLPVLVRKFSMMVFLAETVPENLPLFVKSTPGLLPTLWAIAAGAARTVLKTIKGLALLWRASRA